MWYFLRPQVAWTETDLVELGMSATSWQNKIIGYGVMKHKINMVGVEPLNPLFADSIWTDPKKNWYFDPVTMTSRDKLILPSGVVVSVRNREMYEPWLKRFPITLSRDPSRFPIQFNAMSVMIASRFFDLDIIDLLALDVTISSKGMKYLQASGATVFMNCKTCIFRNKCSFAEFNKRDTDCRIPMAEIGEFAKLFGTNKSSDILAGLRMLVQRSAQRLDDAIQTEDIGAEGLNKAITGLSAQVFNQGLNLAKVLDPNLRASPKIQIAVNGAAATVTSGTSSADPRQFSARMVKELQSSGVPLDKIDSQVVLDYMAAKETADPVQIEAVLDKLRDPGVIDSYI